MSVTRIANRYAKSLLDLAIDRNELDVVLGDVEGLQASLESRDFLLFLRSPVIQSQRKSEILKRMFEGQLSLVTMAFVRRVTVKGRENLLPEILDAFMQQYREMKGISVVTLISAAPLSDQLVQRFKSVLERSKQTHNNVELNTKVDPNLIGGFVIDFDDRLYDASVKHSLDKLKKAYA
jgi:F-type H+-transporting ATPase subunit delta